MGTITATNLGKAYKKYPHRWSRLLEWLTPWKRSRHTLGWVLKDITFSVQPGEALGIIGINGAGKSTLLKVIAGTTQPTTGSVTTEGRVAALLELGMGFHPDFTGRQNAIMAGQLLGYKIDEIAALMPQIEAFAEIGEHIDLPIRIYSSGMQMRLAFSVATAKRPDVLIIDEALSVGDTYFQHKSFSRIREFRDQGTTLLIVSHDKTAIQSICDRAILLNGGHLAMEGNPEAVMDYYNAMLADRQNQTIMQNIRDDGRFETISGTGEAVTTNVTLTNAQGEPLEIVDVGQLVELRTEVLTHASVERLIFGYGIKDRFGQVIYGTNTDLKKQPLLNVPAGSRCQFVARFYANLGPGTYSIQTALVSTETHLENNYEWKDMALIFRVINNSKPHFTGCAWIDPTIEITMT